MPPLQQQSQKEKRQGRRTNPYRRPRLNLVGSATIATFEFVGSQFDWAQAQQLHSMNTVENEWQNMTSSEIGDSTNDYDDSEREPVPIMVTEVLAVQKWPIGVVTDDTGNDNEPQPEDGSTILHVDHIPSVSRRSRSRGNGRVRPRRGRGKGRGGARRQNQNQTVVTEAETVDNENKRRKITPDNNDQDNMITNLNLAINGNENDEIVPMEGLNANDMDTAVMDTSVMDTTMSTTIPEPPEPVSTVMNNKRGKPRGSRTRARGRKDHSNKTRKPRGKRGRPTVISGTTRNDEPRVNDQDDQLESTSDVPQPMMATVPDVSVPEPEPRSTVILRSFLQTLYVTEQPLDRERTLRLGTHLLDSFVSQASCRPFVNPEDESAVYYRLVITRLMDLTTIEHNLWAGEYDNSISKFYDDLAQIMFNAFKFHQEGTIIFNEANAMLAHFISLTMKFQYPLNDLDILDENLAQTGAKLPHEEFGDVCGVAPTLESQLYIVPLYSFRQISKSGSNIAKLPQAAAERLDPMSRPLFNVFERRNLPPVRFQPTETNCNFGRIYITTGAHSVKNCRDERNAILVIVKDVNYMRGENRLRCNAIIAKPFGELHELDTIGFPELQDARYWIRVAFLDRTALDLTVTPKFFDKYLRSPFKVSEYNKEIIPLQQHDEFVAALKLRQANSSPEGLSIWQRLVVEANRANVPIESLESLGRPIQVDAEGFFKRVFHVPGDDKYVVQNFKEISEGTLETRIKEAVCCLKTKGVPNTGQIRSIYKDEDDDELVGLSMERYSYTLKEYAFNTRSPITGEQKFWLIHDMVKGIKALHDAGFAHRDLSEVNMMVNSTTETLLDGSAKPELVVIDFGKAEFINRDDVLDWSVGEVANNKLEYLPWIKTVPDHGYKLYRSAATLPRTKNDHAVLQYPINPCSEDMYAVGVLAWRIFSGQAPWGGILDTDLKNLREIVTDPIKIKFHVEKNVNGLKSRELLLKCITATPQERSNAKELIDWLLQAKTELITEWAVSGRMRIRKQL